MVLVVAFFIGSGAIALTASAETMFDPGGTMAGY
jgi:hypothetical protein